MNTPLDQMLDEMEVKRKKIAGKKTKTGNGKYNRGQEGIIY